MNNIFKPLVSSNPYCNLKKRFEAFLYLSCISFLMLFADVVESRPVDNLFKLRTAIDFGGSIPNTEKFLYAAYFETRFTDSKAKFEEAFITLGVGYILRPDLILWLGQEEYLDIARGDTKAIFGEHRSWQAIQWNFYNAERAQLSLYNRFEERVIPAADTVVQFRIVPRLTLTLPNLISDKYSLIFFEQMYFATAPNTPVIQENRIFAGVTFPTSRTTNMRVGYLNQIENSTPARRIDHNLQVVLTVKMPWDVD